ncbi:glycoside hydrolase family 13 protein [Mycetocola reblochoni]|uniref:Oligo-1,6-glucosidase n=2 Tax=Mycetocola reblochoni TaxID=331618 RepID=A0A1R4KAC9_9MICO|nr:alpha-glucosidase [Mycetocola reblochoni]RLP71176.1 alpha-glucosidase [Mycetocola reblochoni]SJN41085.1 Oligo-1,6-glucosidase [Mycetocola reblochoni REB411]
MTDTALAPLAAPTDDDWWTSAVVYQVYPRSFADSDGDGVGDIRGIIGKVDHLQRLGVDVVWLSPVYTSPQADAGYDISDYQDVDPVFGTLADIDELIAELHSRGMRLVMDLVVNHTSDEHPWFRESRSSIDNPKRDWYWWRDARPGSTPGEPGAEPTNWESFFSGPTWTLDEETGQYYLHLFDPKQPDLNWENPEVRRAVYSMMRWWLDRGVDGFRMDVINLISKDTALPDAEPDPRTGRGDGFPHYAHGPRLHEYLQEMRREVFDGRRPLITVGEMPGVDVDEALLTTDPARRELNMVFQFEHVGLDHDGNKFQPVPLEPGALADSLSGWQEALGETGWNSLYLSNHDQPRAVSRFGDDGEFWRESATALATMLHLQRGTPYIYQGEEIGMTNGSFDDLDAIRDVESLNFRARSAELGLTAEQTLERIRRGGRDNARTPVQWDAGEQAGFSTGAPWIGVNPNHSWLNAAAQYDDEGSVFNHYRRLVALRHENPVVARGDFTRVDAGDPAVFAFERRLGDERLLVVANLSGAGVDAELPADWAGASQVLANYPDDGAARLRPWEARVLAV